MNINHFLQQGKWLPTFSCFNAHELIFHFPISSSDSSASIKALPMSISYKQTHKLAQILSQLLVDMNNQLISQEKKAIIRLNYLSKMYKAVIKEAQQSTTKSYHNILYLTLQHFSYRIKQRYAINPNNTKFIENWLIEVHSLYYKSLPSIDCEFSKQDLLLKHLQACNYQEMLNILRQMLVEKKQKRQKIQFIIELIMKKYQNDYFFNAQTSPKITHEFNKKVKSQLSNKRQTIFKDTDATGKNCIFNRISLIILGGYDEVVQLCQDSWPAFLLHHLTSFNFSWKQTDLPQLALQYLQKSRNAYGNATQKQTELMLLFLKNASSFTLQQKFLQVLPPYFAYFLLFLQQSLNITGVIQPLLCQDFQLNIVRNLFSQSSHIGFKCLISSYSAVIHTYNPEIINEIVQPLLSYHLIYANISNPQQVNDLIEKTLILEQHQLQYFSYSQINHVFNSMAEVGHLSRQFFFAFAICNFNFSSTYDYLDFIDYTLENIFHTSRFNPLAIQELQLLKKELTQRNLHHLSVQLNCLQPFLKNYYLMSYVVTQKNSVQLQLNVLTQLISNVNRSLLLLEILKDVLLSINAKVPLKNIFYFELDHPQTCEFLRRVNQFLNHYSSVRTPQEQETIDFLVKMIL